jgi:hypothetical protein
MTFYYTKGSANCRTHKKGPGLPKVGVHNGGPTLDKSLVSTQEKNKQTML